jgi:class II lanthipeptide synthase
VSCYRDQVATALQAVKVRSATRYVWLGRASRPLPALLDAEIDAAERRNYLVAGLREELYASFYCHGGPVPARWGTPEHLAADRALATAMSEANQGQGSWEPGWTVERCEGEGAVVATTRLRARIPISECRALDGAVRPGADIAVRLPKELPGLSPGFYSVLGETAANQESSSGTVRVYWNVGRTGASGLVGALTSRCNAAGVPFRLKVADHPSRLDRCDAAVLYLPGDAFAESRETLRRVAAGLTAHLRPRIPAFTLALAPGVGLAEDNGASESFGQRRCALLADGIVRAHEDGLVKEGERLDAVCARFAEDGVLIEAPYLEPSLAGRHVL